MAYVTDSKEKDVTLMHNYAITFQDDRAAAMKACNAVLVQHVDVLAAVHALEVQHSLAKHIKSLPHNIDENVDCSA